MNEPNPFSSPQSELSDLPHLPVSNTSSIVVKVFMWILWMMTLLGESILLLYAFIPRPDSEKWLFSFQWVVALAVLLTVVLAIRFLLMKKIHLPWLLLLVFLIGIFIANMITTLGMFAMPQGGQSFILIGIVAVLTYCPYWIKVKTKSKPL